MATTVQKNLLKLALAVDKQTKKGFKFHDSSSSVVISTATAVNPSVITTATAHGYVTGQQVYITGVATNTAVNNTLTNPNWTITVTGTNTFTVPVLGNGAGTGGTVTSELIGSVDGSVFTAQRLLDIYNFARFALFNAMKSAMSKEELSANAGALVTSITNLSFTLVSTISTASKPSGYIDFVGLSNTTDVPILMLDNSLINSVRYGTNLDYKQSATNMFVFDVGSQFVSYGTVGVNSGNSFLTTASTYKLVYYGISEFTLTDVLGNSTTETYNEQYHPMLIELAQAIAGEQSTQDVNILAMKLLGRG